MLKLLGHLKVLDTYLQVIASSKQQQIEKEFEDRLDDAVADLSDKVNQKLIREVYCREFRLVFNSYQAIRSLY